LLGCCHCGQTPSESTPPSVSQSRSQSQSQSQSGASSIALIVCTACIGSVSPAVMKATIGYTGTGANACCYPYNQREYLLYPTVGCDYGSSELPCTTGPGHNNRVLLQFTGSAIRCTYVFFSTGTASIIRWEKPYTPGSLNCLVPHSLDYVRLDFFSPALPRKWSNINLCQTTQSVPASITVGPA